MPDDFAGRRRLESLMTDFARARHWMVEAQIRTSDVTDHALQDALHRLPRERFTPAHRQALAYAETELEVGPGRFLLQPRDLGKLLQAMAPQPGENALELFGGTGYGAALLAAMGCSVVLLEPDADLARLARAALDGSEVKGVVMAASDPMAGWPDGAPYDLILVQGAVEFVPQAWLDQLAEGGRLGVIVRSGPTGQARIYSRAGGIIAGRTVFDAAPPVLPGLAKPAGFSF
jgi:protein-L-isoaspartate(D-aspartate) O-methyltransferase